jgi:GH24 family phage-related lysozyme (muramidase)
LTGIPINIHVRQFDRYYLQLCEKYDVPIKEDLGDFVRTVAPYAAGAAAIGAIPHVVDRVMDEPGSQQPPAIVQTVGQPQAPTAQPATAQAALPTYYNMLAPYLKRVELSPAMQAAGQGGYDPEAKTFKPYGSPESGTMTVGYGHKFPTKALRLAHEKQYPSGMTEAQVHALLINDIKKHETDTIAYVGKDKWDKLDDVQKSMLVDMDFNPGIQKFKKFATAVVAKDRANAIKQYKRYMGSKKNPLTDRNTQFFNTFLQHFEVPK